MKAGYQQINVEGLNLERFITKAADGDIRLHAVRRTHPRAMSAIVKASQVFTLQEIADKGGWHLAVGRSYGIRTMLDWFRRRWFLAAVLIAAIVLILLAGQVVWRIEIQNAGPYEADLRNFLNERGIAPPMLKGNVDIGQLRTDLSWRYPRVAWTECGWRGMTLVIRMVEGVMPGESAAQASCDVIASRDGIIHSIMTYAGTPQVKAGDIVCRGQVLIKGDERTYDGNTKPVAASGVVMARVWDGAAVRIPTVEVETVYTGNKETAMMVKSPWFDLWMENPSAYESYDTKRTQVTLSSLFIPFTLIREERFEAEYHRSMRNMDELLSEAESAALRKLHEKTGFDESLVDKWVNCSMIDDEILQAVAIGERLIDIAVQSPSTAMAAAE